MNRSDSTTPTTPADRRTASQRLTLGLLALLVALGSAAFGPLGASAALDTNTPAGSAIAWLDGELADNGGRLPGFMPGTTDWGLMGDFVLARIATGHGSDPQTRAQAQVLLDNLAAYSTWDAQGPAFSGVRVSGALAKVYLVALGAGLGTTDVGGVNLETEMRSLMLTEGDQAGRFADRNPHGPDYSLALGQSWAMMALSHTTAGVPAQALAFLLDQQCPAGGFRLIYDVTPGCDADTEADPDSTALAIQVLLAVDRTDAQQDALDSALEWLLGRQQSDGSFGGGQFTEAPNANSTGLISQTLRAAGETEAADAATAWVLAQLQIGSNATGTPAAGEIGAIAYDPAGRTAAFADGIADASRDQWRRATAQGVLALGAGLLVEVYEPAPNATTTTTTSTTTTTVAGSDGAGNTNGGAATPQDVAGQDIAGQGTSGGTRLAVTG